MTIVIEDHPDGGASTVPSQEHSVIGVADRAGEDVVFARRHLAAWEQAIDAWTVSLKARRRAKTTIYQRRWQLRKLSETYGHRSPWKLTTADLEAWLNQASWDKEAAKSAQAGIRGFYAWAVKSGRTKRNPAAGLESVKVGRGAARPARDDLVTRVLDAADGRLRLMVMLAYWAGLRASEIGSLRWANIDGTDLFVTGKGGHTRIIPLHADLAAELERWHDGGSLAYRYAIASDVWVFPSRTGQGMHPRSVSRMLSDALGEGVSGHQLRHAFATRLLQRTGDLATTQDLMGHASPATTRIYADPSSGAKRAAIDAL